MLLKMNHPRSLTRERVIYAFQEEKNAKEEWSWTLMAGTILVQVTAPSVWVSYGVISLYFLKYEPFSWHNFWTPVVYTTTWILSEPWFEQLCERIEHSVEYMYMSIVGSLLGWFGLMLVVISPLTQSHLIGLVGFLGGLGTSMCFASTESLLKKHFPLRQGVIRVVVQLLFALSMFCMPIFSFFIMDYYGRHGGLLIHSGIIMQGLVGAVLLKVKKIHTTDMDGQTETRRIHLKLQQLSETHEDLPNFYSELNEMVTWRNPGTEQRINRTPPAPANSPDISLNTTFNSFSNNFKNNDNCDTRIKPLLILNDKIYTAKDCRKHKLTNLFGVEILPEISEVVEDNDTDLSSETNRRSKELQRKSNEAETDRFKPNSIPKPARTFVKLKLDKEVSQDGEIESLYHQLEHKLNTITSTDVEHKYEEMFVSEEHVLDEKDIETTHSVDEHCELVYNVEDVENGEVKACADEDENIQNNNNLNKKALKAQKAQRFYGGLVYSSTTTDNVSYTSDRFLHWQGRRSVLGGLRSNCSICCSSNCKLGRMVDSDLLAILTTPSFIPVLFLLFTQVLSLMTFTTFVTHLTHVHIRDSTTEDSSFSVALAGFMFLCFTIASPCFSTVRRRYHQVICVVALYLMSFSFYMLSVCHSMDCVTLLCCLYGVCHGVTRMTSHTIVKQTFGHGRLHKTKSVFNPLIAMLLLIFSVVVGVVTTTDHYSKVFTITSYLQVIVGVIWTFKTFIKLGFRTGRGH